MIEKLRSFWYERQGLYGLSGAPAAEVLSRAGWARSVGGSNPYLTFFSRAGIGKAEAEAAVEHQDIQELPSARGCTYYVPKEDYALALKASQGTSEVASLNTAKKWLGFTDADLEALNEKVLSALQSGTQTPRELKERLGDAVRNFGEEGKKRGQTTSLPLALGSLQAHGLIRRRLVNGRLDTQDYAYELWNPSPLDGFALTREEALAKIAGKYFNWIGPASAVHFQWFSGLGVGATKEAMAGLALDEVAPNLLIPADWRDAFEQHQPPTEPHYSLISCIDSLILLRRDFRSMVDETDLQRDIWTSNGLSDLDYNAIVDRGRIVGLWEFDPQAGEIASMLFVEPNEDLRSAIDRTQTFIRDELGDARSFSLDSPKSRQPRIAKLRA